MRLEDALTQIATAGGLSADALIHFAREDNVGGRDTGNWPGMSTFADEGKVIYALVRALRPQMVVEVGVDSGGTSTHILSALAANGEGHLWSVDIAANCGLNVPEPLRDRWTFVNADALSVELPARADFCFEDGSHAYEFTRDMLLRLKALGPRVILSHDYYTHETYQGFFVKQGFDEALPGGAGVKIDGAFTGLGYWFNAEYGAVEPDAVSEEPSVIANFAITDEVEPDPIAAPKPKPRARKAAKRG
jgi:hypothetical protein